MNMQANVKVWVGNTPSAFAGKMMLTLFWDFNSPFFEHYQDLGQMVNSLWYCAVLEEALKASIHSKCRGVLITGVVLHHDNAQPCAAAAAAAAATVDTIQKLKFKLLPHPAYSPNVAPSDYHIFRPLKDALCGC
jgi:histone-lysine N-methyltransferase SETMAR